MDYLQSGQSEISDGTNAARLQQLLKLQTVPILCPCKAYHTVSGLPGYSTTTLQATTRGELPRPMQAMKRHDLPRTLALVV